jgi:DNA-binding NarL/FixJ family response regulator
MRYVIIDDNKEEMERTNHLMSLVDGTQLCLKSGYYNGIIHDVIKMNPHLLLLEIELNLKDGFQIYNELSLLHFNGKVVVTTRHEHYSIRAIKAGFFDFLLKPIHIEELKATIHRIRVNGNSYINNKQCCDDILVLLSEREKDIVIQLKMGKTSHEIGEILGITKNTVDTHRRKILDKTGFDNTNELIMKVNF